ncbi:hypothetical protein GOEFS_098_00050 [Gordonia effusa NBRC 100432]|uniref:DUF2993 domain-containing protein n=1 Tax=Gordonia effusa NBRC 100432 TaxID=1077974 RepID=H0R4D8_9ACTN|nr:DUF2993 domain-containing protein [Gordonia effusa]GAB19939.1 hypothetical protein GOEFS_098_00050 [Gordonia effusa NBRC 100432]
MSFTAAGPPAIPTSDGADETARSARPRLRRAVIVGLATALVVVVALVIADTVLAARSEKRLSEALQTSPRLEFAPEVTLGGMPFISHANSGEFPSLTVTARGVPLPRSGSVACVATQCWAELGITATGIRADDGWSFHPTSHLFFDTVNGYAKLDSVNLGRLLDITDLSVNTPAPEGKAGGGGPGDGLLERSSGLLLTGTVALPPGQTTSSTVPPSASSYRGDKIRVSVSVDVAVRDDALVIRATDFYDGPEEHASADVPAQYRQAILDRFSRVLPMPALPWGIIPTSAHSAGSDVLISGDSVRRRVRVDEF